ncbi:MAG: hypothetical protein JW746_07395 [Candidatus Krumholzibacteriota bacterium]|nr:hypothetical protein [Candidatus Krumholzibacteriota bacterium]
MMTPILKKTYDALNIYLSKFQIIFITVLFGMGLLLLLFPNSYWANDNIGIIPVIKLGFTTSFMSAILGRFLSLFYLYIHYGFPWYAVFLYLIHGLSITFFIYSATLAISNGTHLFRILLLYLVIYSMMVLRLGYNAASIMIGANSLLLFCLYLKKSVKIRRSVIFLLGISFSFSYLLRTRSIYGIIIFSLPVLILFFIYLKNRKYPYILLFLLPAILFIGLNNYYTANFTSARYKEYVEYNKVRGRFHDFPISEDNIQNKRILDANDWSRNDYVAFSSWFFHDENIFSIEKINNIFEHSVTQDKKGLPLKEIAGNIGIFCYTYLIYLITLVFILLTIGFYSSHRTVIMSLVYSMYCLGGMLYMNESYRFPERIGIPVFLLVYSYLALIFIITKTDYADGIDSGNRKVRPKYDRILYVFYTAVLILGVFAVKWEIIRIHSKQSDINEIVDAINRLPSDSVVMFQPARGLEPVYYSPLKSPAIKNDINIITGGWNIFSERYYYQTRKAGVENGQDLFPYLIDNDRLYLVIASSSYKRCVATYFKEHYQNRISWIRVAKAAGRTVYKITGNEKETQRRKPDNNYQRQAE